MALPEFIGEFAHIHLDHRKSYCFQAHRRRPKNVFLQEKENVMKPLIAFFAAAALSAPLLAQSADDFIAADISLQSGPDAEYPPVDQLAAGTPVTVEGCIDGWTWCDVSVGGLRGWVPGTYIEQDYGGQWVYITDYGPRIGLPIVVFSLDAYWGAHYHDRPWFNQRESWAGRQIHPHMPTRPQGEAHAPPQRATQQAAPPANSANHPPAVQQMNPRAAAKTEPRSNEPGQPRETRPQARDATTPHQPERTAPSKPTSEPANRPQSAAPKSTNPPQPKPENKPKAEPKAPVKKDTEDHRDESNGHDAEARLTFNRS
jgi:uncharacterized protein YraI